MLALTLFWSHPKHTWAAGSGAGLSFFGCKVTLQVTNLLIGRQPGFHFRRSVHLDMYQSMPEKVHHHWFTHQFLVCVFVCFCVCVSAAPACISPYVKLKAGQGVCAGLVFGPGWACHNRIEYFRGPWRSTGPLLSPALCLAKRPPTLLLTGPQALTAGKQAAVITWPARCACARPSPSAYFADSPARRSESPALPLLGVSPWGQVQQKVTV